MASVWFAVLNCMLWTFTPLLENNSRTTRLPCHVDGKETPIVKANYILRAVQLPAGEHKIEFKFHPDSYYTGDRISFASSIVLLLIAAGSIVLSFRRKKQTV